MSTVAHWRNLWTFRAFFITACQREIKGRYVNSSIGAIWLVLNPVLQLIIYYFVFEKIFQVKFNTLAGQDFIAFVAVGLWPWVAFSEGLLAGTQAMDKHQGLLKKIQVPHTLLVLVEVTVPYIIHLMGFIFILLVLWLFGQQIALWWLPVVLIVYVLQLLFCFSLSLALCALQVFLKDVGQALTPIMMVWFYLTPIIYPERLIPDSVKSILSINPMVGFVTAYRQLLLDSQWLSAALWFTLLFAVVLCGLLGHALFRRLSVRFEDMF